MQWTAKYCKIGKEKFEEIKKGVQMEYVENLWLAEKAEQPYRVTGKR